MNREQKLSLGAGGFLIVVGLLADATKILLDILFGVGIILDPLLITPVTALIFGITLSHNGIPMFSGKRSWAGWTNLIVSLIPVLDFLPDWTVYAIYLTVKYR
jgi:hypothetical protein